MRRRHGPAGRIWRATRRDASGVRLNLISRSICIAQSIDHFVRAPLRIPSEKGWGDRRDSNPQQLESQSRTLPLSYGHHCAAQYQCLACPAGLEPTTPSLEGWCSIRLSYGQPWGENLVGVGRFELPTSCSQSKRATRLRYTPRNRG